jgi:hypothetical protein
MNLIKRRWQVAYKYADKSFSFKFFIVFYMEIKESAVGKLAGTDG